MGIIEPGRKEVWWSWCRNRRKYFSPDMTLLLFPISLSSASESIIHGITCIPFISPYALIGLLLNSYYELSMGWTFAYVDWFCISVLLAFHGTAAGVGVELYVHNIKHNPRQSSQPGWYETRYSQIGNCNLEPKSKIVISQIVESHRPGHVRTSFESLINDRNGKKLRFF